MQLAHHIALELKLGRRVKGCALHSCDNPPCTNPNHLREGTHKQNYADMRKRGREVKATGSRNKSTKLTPRKVRAIRASSDTKAVLARRYKVTHQSISAILKRKTWDWLQ